MDATKAAVVRQMKGAFKNEVEALGQDQRVGVWSITNEDNLSLLIRVVTKEGPRYFEVRVKEHL